MNTLALVFALVTAAVAKVAYDRIRHPSFEYRPPAHFMQLRPDLYRLAINWIKVPGLMEGPICMFAIRTGISWILIDAGEPSPATQNLLTKSIEELIQNGEKIQLLIGENP